VAILSLNAAPTSQTLRIRPENHVHLAKRLRRIMREAAQSYAFAEAGVDLGFFQIRRLLLVY
jgi:hypothetical protein